MPREQCKRRSLRLVECRSHLTFSTIRLPRIKSGVRRDRSDACRAGRCSDISKVRCTSKSSHVRTGSSVCEAQVGRIDFVRCRLQSGRWLKEVLERGGEFPRFPGVALASGAAPLRARGDGTLNRRCMSKVSQGRPILYFTRHRVRQYHRRPNSLGVGG